MSVIDLYQVEYIYLCDFYKQGRLFARNLLCTGRETWIIVAPINYLVFNALFEVVFDKKSIRLVVTPSPPFVWE